MSTGLPETGQRASAKRTYTAWTYLRIEETCGIEIHFSTLKKNQTKTTEPAEPASISPSATQTASKHTQGSLKALSHFRVVINLHFSNELFFPGPILFLLLSLMPVKADLHRSGVFNLSSKSSSIHVFVICYKQENKIFLDPGNQISPHIICVGQARDYFKSPALAVFLHFLFYEVNIKTQSCNFLQKSQHIQTDQKVVLEVMYYLEPGDTVMTPLTLANNQIPLLSVTHMHQCQGTVSCFQDTVALNF